MATALTTPLLTLEQFESMPDDGQRHELDVGVLISMPPIKPRHSTIALRLYDALGPFVRDNRLGELFLDSGFLLSPRPPTVRAPDVSFLSSDRADEADLDQYIPGAPTLAVEVVSPSDRAEQLNRKTEQYLATGSEVVLVIYPKTASVHVHRRSQPTRVLSKDEALSDEVLFPGWDLPIARLFESRRP